MATHSSAAYQRGWHKLNPKKKSYYDKKYYQKYKASHNAKSKIARLKKFGLTELDYQAKFDSQDGLCAICRHPEEIIDPRNGKRRALALDHDHRSGKIRDLLCGSCNRALGFLKEDLLRVEAMATYIRKHSV